MTLINSDCAQFHGYQDLALSIGKTNDLISSLQLQGPQRQTAVTDYFK